MHSYDEMMNEHPVFLPGLFMFLFGLVIVFMCLTDKDASISAIIFGCTVGLIFIGVPVGHTIHNLHTSRWFRERLKEECERLGVQVGSWEELDRIKKDRERQEREEQRLKWFEPRDEVEQILQRLADGLLEIHNWDGMPRVKVQLNPELEYMNDRSAHYSGSFHLEDTYNPVIEYKPSYYHNADIGALKRTMKHELVHAWIDWRGIQMDDPHGHEFQEKLREVS